MMSDDAEYLPLFDWLRGVLAVVVMLSHDGLLWWADAANFAVQVFFALSGWLIGGILLRTSRAGLPRFFYNRSVRIWVPYYLAFVALVGAGLLRDEITTEWSQAVVYKLTFVYNLFGMTRIEEMADLYPLAGTGNHFWSVNAEEQFYLIAPLFIVVLAATVGRRIAFWAALALVAAFTIEYSAILFGVTAAVAAVKYPGWHRTLVAQVVLVMVALAATAGLIADTHYNATVPFLALPIVLLLARPGPQSAVGAVVGGMSYPLYLNHWMGVFIANELFQPFDLVDSPPRKVLASLISLTIALLHYRFIDRVLREHRSQWYTARRGTITTAAAYSIVGAGLVIGLSWN